MIPDQAVLTQPTPRLAIQRDLLDVWRAASAELGVAWRAWCDGDGTWAAVSGALDREESAAGTLASFAR